MNRLYKHFKGALYEIVCEARDSEDRNRELIVYRSKETNETWVRPKAMFAEHVERDGYSGPRFRPMKLKPTEVCRRCNHTEKEHWHAFTDACGVEGCRCDEFQPTYDVVEMEAADGVSA